MDAEEARSKISKTLSDLEMSGDLLITTTTPHYVADELVRSLGCGVDNLLNDDEFIAILNSLNVIIHGINLDNRDFQTIIGIEKEDLKVVFDKFKMSRPST